MQISQISPKVKTHLTALLVYNKNSLLLFFPSSESDALKTQCITLLMKIPGLILGKVRKWNIQRFVSQRQHIHTLRPCIVGFSHSTTMDHPLVFSHTLYISSMAHYSIVYPLGIGITGKSFSILPKLHDK